MNELMKELAELAKAGTEYLKAKKAESEGFLELARRRAEKDLNPLVPAAAAAGPQPTGAEKPAEEPAASKKPRRTKEQIAADAAAAQAKATADAQAKLAAEGGASQATVNAALTPPPAPQQPAAAAPAANPLGDLGAFGAQPPAPSLKEQIADAQAKTAALQPQPRR